MRVGIVTWGTEGDIRPFISLAHALKQRGHGAEIVYTSVEGRSFEALAAAHGVEARDEGSAYFREHRDALQRAARMSLENNSPPEQFEVILRDLMDPVADGILDRALELAGRCDVLVGHALTHPVATAAAKRGRPYAALALQPVFRSWRYPPAGAPDLGGLFNRAMWLVADLVMRRALAPRIARQRSAQGLPDEPFDACRGGPGRRTLVAVSPTLFPRPDDWPEHLELTGFLALPTDGARWQPDDALAAFLDRGAPVFASFGSMLTLDDTLAEASVTAFVEAAKRAGVRLLVQCPPAVAARFTPSDALAFVTHAPHSALFPRCSLVVHHGGAGTTQSALAAGRPSVVVPHAADQFYWGDALHARGVAAKPLRRTRLDADALAGRIRWALERPELTTRAGALAEALAREDGARDTVAALERFVSA